jgi:hypothetical protein
VNYEPLVSMSGFDNNKSGSKVQWLPTLSNPSNNNSNNPSVSINQPNKLQERLKRNKTHEIFVTQFGPTITYVWER